MPEKCFSWNVCHTSWDVADREMGRADQGNDF